MAKALPPEVMCLILEQLALLDAKEDERPSRLKTLSNACLASKSLYRLAWPILYREFDSDTVSADPNDGYTAPARLALSRYLRTICLSTERGPALRSLTIRPWVPVEITGSRELLDFVQGGSMAAALFQ